MCPSPPRRKTSAAIAPMPASSLGEWGANAQRIVPVSKGLKSPVPQSEERGLLQASIFDARLLRPSISLRNNEPAPESARVPSGGKNPGVDRRLLPRRRKACVSRARRISARRQPGPNPGPGGRKLDALPRQPGPPRARADRVAPRCVQFQRVDLEALVVGNRRRETSRLWAF